MNRGWKRAFAALFITTVASAGIYYFNNASNYGEVLQLILAIIALVMGVCVDLWFRHSDLDERFSGVEGKIDAALNEAAKERLIAERITKNELHDPIFGERFRDLKREIADLSEGVYHIRSLDELYHDDIRSIQALKHGEKLFSLCPVCPAVSDAVEQFASHTYIASLAAHDAAQRDGVMVTRVYRFKNLELFNRSELRQHLKDLASTDMDIRVLFQDRAGQSVDNFDFLVFGDKKVSVGKIGPNGMIVGADVYLDRNHVSKYLGECQKIWNTSAPIRELLAK